MLSELLILAAATPELDAVDDANLALVTCGYAAYRHANEQDQALDQFARTLSSRCSNEIADMRRTVIALDVSRGRSRTAATANANTQIADFRARLASQYARRAEIEAQLRALERAMREEGMINAQ